MNKKILFILLFLPLFLQAQITPQQQTELNALNNYLQFTNESTHGLLIVHRLLETFNQKTNKYVDLENNQLNFYSNADLPKNIFADPEHWFYDTSPLEWYDKAKAEGKKLPAATSSKLNKEMDKMKSIINRVNALRFELEDLTKQEDLKERKNLATIYEKMEEAVALYDDFNAAKKLLKNGVQKRYNALKIANSNKELGNMVAIHENIRAFLEGVRGENETNRKELAQHLKNNIATAKSFKIGDRNYQNVIKKADAFSKVAQKYLAKTPFPPEYKLYGETYYYYNVEMVAKFNRYGSGLVTDLNKWITDNKFPVLIQLEEPHYFKVIYPKREIPKVEKIETITTASVPSTVKDREIVIRQNQIFVSPGTIVIEVYDHQQQDGDIISLNYNGHWILENYTLKRKAKKMSLPLKAGADNYLILHAENLGLKPPNTATISYVYKGQKKKIVLESDLNQSEMIRINVQE